MASTRIETSTTASSGGGASGNQMANLRDTLTPIEPIVVTYEAVRSSVGLVIIQSPGGTNAAGPSAPSFTCALVRFDRIDTGERFYCLLSRVPDIGSIPLTQSETGPQGPLAQSSPERALGPGTPRGPESQGPSARLPTEELSRLSLAREPDIARDQQRTADTGSAGDTRPPGHRTAANVLASAPSIALLAEANFQFACGASFHGLDVLYPYCDPEGPVLLELTSKCVTSLHRMGLAFLPIWYEIPFHFFLLRSHILYVQSTDYSKTIKHLLTFCSTNTTALQTNAELSMVQYVNGVLCFSKGPIMSTDSDGYRVRYRIASGRGSGGAPLLDENNAVVAVHMSRNEEDPEEKVGQTVRSMVALFFNNRHSNYIPGYI